MQSLRVDMVGRKHLSSLVYSSISHSRAYFEFSAKKKFHKTKPTRKPGLTNHHERQLRIRETNRVHKNAWSLFQCANAGLPAKCVAHLKSLVGIQEAADMEDLNTDEWRHMPETDQIILSVLIQFIS